MAEIDETQLANYRNLSDLMGKMMADPNARKLVQQAHKAINPNVVIPEIDATKPIMEEIGKVREELAAEKKAREDETTKRVEAERRAELNGKWGQGQGRLREQGYTAEGIGAIEKIMEERGIVDHEVAAAYFDRLNPPTTPVASSGNRFDIFSPEQRSDENIKMLFDGKVDSFLNTTINQALKDVRGK